LDTGVPGLEQLLAGAGAQLATPGAGRDEQALALMNQALAIAPDDPLTRRMPMTAGPSAR